MRLALLALAALGCATPAPASRRPVHGEFDKGAFEATWQRAVDALRAEGYELGLADASRGIAFTVERELSVPCGGQRCLSRDVVMVKLERDGRATLAITRRQWDQASGTFRQVSDPPGLALLERTEQSLLAAMTGRTPEIRFGRAGESCTAEDQCETGLSCRDRRCSR